MPERGPVAPRLPPLNALRVFHVALRHASLRAAADELRVSPQAVSQQLKLLESHLGAVLFLRRGRTLEATEAARQLAPFVQAGFAEFEAGVRRIARSTARPRIHANVSPWFATRHLLERLSRFQARLPGAELRLTTMVDLPDFAAEDLDVAIQWGFGRWKGFDQTLLLRDLKVIACAPALAERISGPADLLSQTLLHPVLASDLWDNVLRHLGVDPGSRAADLRMADAATLRSATRAGLGVGLVSLPDAIEDIAAGRLAAPFGTAVMQQMPPEQVPGFWLVLPRAHRRDAATAAFCDWVESEDWTLPPVA